MRVPSILVLLLACTAIGAAEHVIFVSDDHLGGIFQAIDKGSRDAQARLGIKVSDYGQRGLTTVQLLEELDRRVLKKAPTRVVIGLGAHDLWDFRAKKATGTQAGAVIENLRQAVQRVQDGGATVILATPPAFGPEAPELRAAMAGFSEALRGFAGAQGLEVLDIFAATTADGTWKSAERIDRSAEAAVVEACVRKLGMASSTLPALRSGDRVVFLVCGRFHKAFDLRSPLPERIAAKYGEGITYVIANREFDLILKDPDQLKNQNATVLVLFFGQTNLAAGMEASEFAPLLTRIVDRAQADGIRHIALLTPFPQANARPAKDDRIDPDAPYALRAKEYADAIHGIGQKTGCLVLDAHARAVALLAKQPDAVFSFGTVQDYGSGTPQSAEIVNTLLIEAFGLGGGG